MLNTFPNYSQRSPEEQQQWSRLDEFNLSPIFPALIRENNWSREFANRASLEFKKYVFISIVSEQSLSPSPMVDLVWHQFLLHTKLYWDSFCPNVLQQPLHHNPSQGKIGDRRKYRSMYRRTLIYYEYLLGDFPPVDIWERAIRPTNLTSNLRLLS
jgi:hypothetical protein